MKTCEILAQISTSGEYKEILFGEDYGTFTRVKFSEQSTSWVGVFQNGFYPSRKNQALIVADYAIVLADGILYLVDLQTKTTKILRIKDDIQAIIADEKQIFAAAFTSIGVFDYNGNLIRDIQSYYLDMFEFSSINITNVYASYYQVGGCWAGLTVDRQTMEIIGRKAS